MPEAATWRAGTWIANAWGDAHASTYFLTEISYFGYACMLVGRRLCTVKDAVEMTHPQATDYRLQER